MSETGTALGVRITQMLADRGVSHIFGIPGVHNQELYRGLPGSGITHVLARHEQGAGFMADGYARATGKPGVAYVITGPGLLNILTPLGQAYSDSVPVLAISSCLDDSSSKRGQLHQMLDQRAAGATVCAASDEAGSADAAYALIDRAFAAFESGRSRPRHIQVPITVLETGAPPAPGRVEIGTQSEGLADFGAVADLLRTARKPILIFGGGAVSESAQSQIARLLDASGALAFTTYAGRGLVSPDHRNFVGSYLAQASAKTLLGQADLVIAIGTELSECDLWRDDLGHNAPLVRIDIDEEVLSDRHRAEFPVRADAVAALNALATGLEATGVSPKDWAKGVAKSTRAACRAAVEASYPGIGPVADALRACLPDDTMIYSDMTQFAYAAKEIWDMPRAGHWHHPTGFGTLGYALPAAIGGKVGRGDKPTLAIAGDYGFQYTCNELATAVELNLSLPILLWDNGRLGAIEDSMTSAQIEPNAVIARNPDFLKLARAYGAAATKPSTLGDLCEAVNKAFHANGPTLIHMSPGLAG